MKTHFVDQTAAASMPSSCKGVYRRVAVLEVPIDVERATMISERARNCFAVVATWEKCHVGKTPAGAYQVAMREAHFMAERLNTVLWLLCESKPCGTLLTGEEIIQAYEAADVDSTMVGVEPLQKAFRRQGESDDT